MGIKQIILLSISIILLSNLELMAAPEKTKPHNVAVSSAEKASQNKQITGWRRAAEKRGMSSNGYLALIMTQNQRMILLPPDGAPKEYIISTSKFGVGNIENSNKTPLGWHRVNERIGHGRPVGAVFSSRAFTGKVIPRAQLTRAASEDMVLTRIMWLEGLEPGKNSGKGIDSHDRCIYIHGTNQEQLLGQPSSHGCIRMFNDEVIELFEMTMNTDFYCVIL
jgi:lipoprotein-anchoring transpeptidase ErfK/SrfK